jgi:hypothetical protein
MKRSLLALMVVSLAGCGGGGGNGDGGGGGEGGGGGSDVGYVDMTLKQVGGSGTVGTATLQAGADSAEVTLQLTNADDGAALHIHEGSCADPAGDAEVAHDLGIVNVNLGQAILAAPLEEVATGEFYIDVHDARDPNKVVACGVIPEQ